MNYSNDTNKKLVTMYKNKTLKKDSFSLDVLRCLYSDGIIKISSAFCDDVYLTDKGESYIEDVLENFQEKRSNKIHQWINSVVAVLSLILAITSLLLQLCI